MNTYAGEQLTFKDILKPDYSPNESIEERFLRFHTANPHVARALARMALDLKRSGVKKVGIARLYERLRWNNLVQTKEDNFKLNNNHRALYSRLIMNKVPELEGFFTKRTRQTK